MKEMEQGSTVDIFNCIFKMRNMRPNMVQTPMQYAFLYQCVLQHYRNCTGLDIEEEPSYQAPRIPDLVSSVKRLSLGTISDFKDSASPVEAYPDPPPFPEGFGDDSS
ncbi:uncharacterized protein LOC121862897 [Homarus americanus]|nr:uncharacterized protein LOC121862897 [Homarus americanus]